MILEKNKKCLNSRNVHFNNMLAYSDAICFQSVKYYYERGFLFLRIETKINNFENTEYMVRDYKFY